MSSEGHTEKEIRISEAVTSGLKSLTQAHKLTLNTLVQGAWALLLSHYSGESDVVFEATRACRRLAVSEAESMRGLLLNTLPLRVSVSSDKLLLTWLMELQAQWIAMLDYDRTPLTNPQEWGDIHSSKSLFESLLLFENDQMNSVGQEQGSSLEKRLEFQLWEQFSFPVKVFGSAAGAELLLKIEYDRQRFEQATMTRMLGHLATLLEGMAANPHQCLAKLPLLTAAERQQLLVDWNDTQVNYPQEKCIHQLFEAQVERTPDAVAVVWPAIASQQGQDEQLTYQELNCRANQLAHHLQQLGVGPDVLVAINLTRSLDVAIAILSVLKAGGAYVPLDPAYPTERLAFMLADTQAPIVLTQAQLVQGLPAHQARVICLDTDWEAISRNSKANPASSVTLDNLTYAIYTSGSTGRPKGVALEHRALSNLISWQIQNSKLTSGARTLQFASLSFDVSFQEMFSTWCAGGTLVLISEELRRDAASLLQFINAQKIERLFLPFIALQHLAEAADLSGIVPSTLSEIVTAGEQLQINPYITRLFTQLKNCTLYNQYGPSESHVVTAFTLTGSPGDWPALPPIGRPIANTQIYLLDQHLQPVPVGVPGELYIGGICLARGYLNRPDITAEKFIPNPFRDFGLRLYKTGDVARYLPDGNIEYLGRIDNQVKIRGFRIELGEIETVLATHPGLKQAVVMVRDSEPGDKRLVAYLVAKEGQQLVTTDLRRYLLDKLPDYMIPSNFITVAAMPQTPSGKIDRRALPAPESQRPQLEQTYVAPHSELECFLASLWSGVLKLDRVGIHDNFFELGGNSLLTLQIVTQVQQKLEIDLPAVKLFQYPTIGELANYLSAGHSDRSSYDKHQDRAQRQKAAFDRRKQSTRRQ